VLQREEAFRSAGIHDAGGEVLGQVLRGVGIEYRRTSTCLHLASADTAQVDSMLLALDQIIKTREAIRRHLENETARAAAYNLLTELVAEARDLRDSLWPEHYRSCEALTRLLDTLELAQHSLTSEAVTTRSQ
jgi:hypothetical protein